jgi:REP element-mobilizing transposase RayT
MLFYRRRLPHWFPDQSVIFATWRLAGSPPPRAPEFPQVENGGLVPFWSGDECLDRSGAGPFWLQDRRVAEVVQDALRYGATVRHSYDLHAWAIMPNHVHAVLEPRIPMPDIMRWLKGRTSRTINRLLGRTGQAFWQDESYDHWIRSTRELDEVIAYVESNPVRAGLVRAEDEWRWSSAGCRADHEKRWSAPR